MNLLLAFIVAMVVTVALVPLLTRYAGTLHVMDAPNARKVHAVPVPRVGGIAMFVGSTVALLPWLLQADARLSAVLLGGAVVFLFGLVDDRAELSAPVKFTGQLLGIAIVVGFGDVAIDCYSLTERHALPAWIGLSLTVFFILGVTNAINLADGLDGLAGGTTLLSLLALGIMALSVDYADVAVLALAIAGAILGFLRFNTWPARIFMGDCGSQFLGFMAAVLSVMFSQHSGATVSVAVPLLLLGLPVVDTLMVMAQRAREGRPLFAADRRHVHHKLLDLGFDHHEAVAVIYGIQGLFFLAAWFMRFEPDTHIVAVFIGLAGGAVGLLILAGRRGWRWRRSPRDLGATLASGSRLRLALHWLAQSRHLPRWSLRIAAVCVLGYLGTVALEEARVSIDVAWLAGALGLVLAATLYGPQGRPEWLARAALYIAMTLAVFLDHQAGPQAEAVQLAKRGLLPLLVACVALRMRLTQQRRFELTTLDVLLIFVAVAVPNLPGLFGSESNVGLSVAKLVVLFYAIELFCDQSRLGERWVGTGVIVFLAVVAARAIG